MNGFKRYVRSICSYLHCNSAERGYYAQHIETCLGNDAQALCYEEIVHRLGTPEDWIVSQVENLDSGRIVLQSIHSYKRVRKLAIIISSFFLAFLIAVAWFHIWDHHSRLAKSIDSDPIVISYSLAPEDDFSISPN